MKNVLFLVKLLMLTLIIFVATGCPTLPPPDLSSSIRLIKFNDSTDKNYILAHYESESRYSDGEYAQVMRFNMCTSHSDHHYIDEWRFDFPESHRFPYWDLPNGWLLIDWRYYGFPYNKDQAVVLNQKWETLYQYDSWFFPKDMIRHKNPIVEWIEVDLHLLGTALEKTYSTEVLQLVNQTKNIGEFYDDTQGNCACEIPDKLDSIWSVFQADLSNFIEAGNRITDVKVH